MATDRRLWFTHKCRFCSYFFVCEKDLVHHEATHDAPDFACDSCCCIFDDAEQLSTHVNDGCSAIDSSTDIGRQHVCGTCGEIFRFVRELYKHYGENHMNEEAALATTQPDNVGCASVCADCGAIFSCTASLKVHLWKAHNLNFVQQQDHIVKKNGPSTVTCRDSCAASTCRRLLVASNKDKPFKCSMCNWSFKYDFSFRAHLKMHEERQRLLGEMLHANCEGQSSVVDELAVGDEAPDNSASGSSEVRLPIVLLPLKRKFGNSDDANSSVSCDRKCARSSYRLTTGRDVDMDSMKQVGSEVSSDLHSVDRTLWKPVSVRRVSSEHQSPNLSPVVGNTSDSVIKQLESVDCLPQCEEPLRFACKLCSFKCRYDFSYIAHLNQHDKLKELEIDDLQSHLVASSTQTLSGSYIPNEFAIKVISSDTEDVSYVNGHKDVVSSGTGISYVLLCPGAVDQTGLVTGLPEQQQCDRAVITQPTVAAGTIDCLNSNVVLVDDVNTSIEHDLDSATRPATDDEDVDFSVGPEMQFLDSTSGETLYVVNEADLQVALPAEATSEHQNTVVYEDTETEVVLSPQPSDRPLLDVTSFCSHEDGHSDESAVGEDSFECYYCNAVFANKSHLERHILQLHVD